MSKAAANHRAELAMRVRALHGNGNCSNAAGKQVALVEQTG